MAMDGYENVAVFATRRCVLAGCGSMSPGTYVKFTPVGAEMFADWQLEITDDAIPPRSRANSIIGVHPCESVQ
jgi:hypothetical protein